MFQEVYDQDYLDFYSASTCLGDLGEKWCNFKWRIHNLQLNPIERLRSPAFTSRLFQNEYWYLELELSSPGDLRTMEISLNRLPSLNKTVLIVDVIYKVVFSDKIKISDRMILAYNNEPQWDDRMSFSALFQKSKNNYFTIECKLRPNKTMVRDVRHGKLDKSLPIDLRKLLLTSDFCDTIIRIEGYRLLAHIAILQARLPQILDKCLTKKTDPSNKDEKHTVIINDLPVSVGREMLKYAYTGQGYVDLESVSHLKDVIVSYSENFFHSCCWEDNPFAETYFNYETDSLSWRLENVFRKRNLESQSIDLLRLSPGKIKFSLNVDEPKENEKMLMLSFEFLTGIMTKPIIISCASFLVNKETNASIALTETETLLRSTTPKGRTKICSLLQLKEESINIRTNDSNLILQTDLKFCYGSSKSSIENLYEGEFDISQCTGCPRLSADMDHLYLSGHYWNMKFESSDEHKLLVHKAILLARFRGIDASDIRNYNHLLLKNIVGEALSNYVRSLYNGIS